MPKQALDQYEFSPLKLWSPLQRQLAASGQTKGTPQQWIGTIRNLQKKGVSAVEIEWSKIIRLLEVDPAPIHHIDDLLAFLMDRPPCELVLQRHVTEEYVPLVRYVRQQRPPKLPPVEVRHGLREIRLLHYSDRTFGLCIWLHIEHDAGLFGRNFYWSFSIPRGRKKIAPYQVKREFGTPQEAMAYGRLLIERMARRLAKEGYTGTAKSANRFTRFVLPGGEHYTEWLITAPNFHERYLGPHFDIPNIIAHVRTTERISITKERLLLLEEIQSDWNQALRAAIQAAKDQRFIDDEGNEIIEWDEDANPPPFNPYLNHWLEAALRMILLYAANQGYAGISWLPGKLHAERFPWANADGLKTFYDHFVPAAVEKLAKSWRAQLGEAQFSTMRDNFIVQKLANGKWILINLDSGQTIGHEFPDQRTAETFRNRTMNSMIKKVPTLYLSDEMRDDIRDNGLPYLGAVGKRLS